MEEREPGVQPLDDDAAGCTLVFTPIGLIYQPMAALGVLAGLNAKEFNGLCECYIRPGVTDGEYLMGVGLLFADDPPPDWWEEYASTVGYAVADDEHVRLAEGGWEPATVGELRAAMWHAGTAGFVDGVAVWVSDPAGPDPDSPFTFLCRNAR